MKNNDLYACQDVERSILGTIMASKKAATYTLERVSPGDFYRDSHRIVFQAIQQMASQNIPIELISLTQYLKDTGFLPQAGGVAELAAIRDLAFEPSTEHYVSTLKEKAERRQLRAVLQKNLSALDSPELATDDVFITAQQDLYKVIEKKTNRKYQMALDLMVDYTDLLEARKKEKQGLSWGFSGLDNMVGMIMPGRVYYVGARPAMGKTAFALSVACNIARKGTPVYLSSMEMSKEQIADRYMSMTALINGHILQHGYIEDDDWDRVLKSASLISSLCLAIDDERQTTSNLTLKVRQFKADMLQRAKAYRAEDKENRAHAIERVGGCGVVMVDYLQLFKNPPAGLSLDQYTSQLSGAMVDLAKDLNVAVICLTQLNRENEKTASKRPQLSHLRGGGSQEQDAWAVLLLHREDYYLEDEENGLVEVIVAKNRSGPSGSVTMRFLKEFTKFSAI